MLGPQRADRWLLRYAVGTAVATFGLLVAGGLVSATDSGLACPDWPLCEGEFFPRLVNGKEFEHTHRLVASFVGAATFGLAALIVKHRRWDRVLVFGAIGAAILVVVQAMLGALTVWWRLPVWVSSTHLATAMAFFCLAVTLALLVLQRTPGRATPRPGPELGNLAPWVLACLGATYAQVVAGAVMRHLKGGLSCGFDFPLCLGVLWPQGRADIQAHMVHRLLGVVVTAAVSALAIVLWRRSRGQRAHRTVALGLAAGVWSQAVLGVFAIWTSRDLAVMTVHSSLGALLLAAHVALYWQLRPSAPPAVLRDGSKSAGSVPEPA